MNKNQLSSRSIRFALHDGYVSVVVTHYLTTNKLEIWGNVHQHVSSRSKRLLERIIAKNKATIHVSGYPTVWAVIKGRVTL